MTTASAAGPGALLLSVLLAALLAGCDRRPPVPEPPRDPPAPKTAAGA